MEMKELKRKKMYDLLDLLTDPKQRTWESDVEHQLRLLCCELKLLIDKQQKQINKLQRRVTVIDINQLVKV